MLSAPSAGLRRRSIALLLFAAMLSIGAACGSPASDLVAVQPTNAGAETRAVVPGVPDTNDAPLAAADEAKVDSWPDSSDQTRLDLAAAITELPPARTGLPQPQPTGPQPTGLTIDALGIDTATVIDVGVEDNGDMEIPPADQVGWYRFGSSPGDRQGSAVLAAHIAFDGQNGVFVDLDELEIGELIVVSFDDGTSASFVATDKQQYDKNELPDESIFARDGDPQLVLITCGGDFNRSLRSYEDNVVIYASPVETS